MLHTILYISPGPIYTAHTEAYQRPYIELSKSFKGYIFATSPQKEHMKIGNFDFISVKYRGSITNILFYVSFCFWNALKLRMRKEKIDLVSTYDPLKTGLIGMVVSKILGAKFAPEVKGVYTSPAEWVDNEDSMETRLKKRIYPLIMYIVLRSADGIRLLFKEQIDCFGKILHGKIIRHFPSYVAINNFQCIKEEKEVLFIGYPFKRKGVDVLINAFKLVSSKSPDWKLKIIGWYPNPLEIDNAIGKHPQIVRQNPVPHKEIPDHIGSCGIFVLPSRSEAMGRVLVEAMAAGKPRIGSNVDGIPTVIENGVDGLLFESENIDDLAEKLDILMNSSEIRKKLGKNGEERARTDFTIEKYCNNLEKYYLEVLGNN